jgi:hypothetical protein
VLPHLLIKTNGVSSVDNVPVNRPTPSNHAIIGRVEGRVAMQRIARSSGVVVVARLLPFLSSALVPAAQARCAASAAGKAQGGPHAGIGRAHRPWRRVSRIISRAGYDFDDLLAKAKTKDLGLQPFFMAGSLLQVRQFQHLPNTMPPLALPELQAFIISLTDRLLDQSRPPENSL